MPKAFRFFPEIVGKINFQKIIPRKYTKNNIKSAKFMVFAAKFAKFAATGPRNWRKFKAKFGGLYP